MELAKQAAFSNVRPRREPGSPATSSHLYGRPTTRGNRYSDAQRRTFYWSDIGMDLVTWRIVDHVGYNGLIDALRAVHKTAVAAFPDGAKYRKDPTKVDAEG
ncbi:hypothetical protein AB4Z09_18125 [Rhodococcus sp. TAF43]|uniref:hypothetical protein n=1 Tax=Rhodococcus sp. TAF43 TaxID=3237483 RepID=UPI003F9B3AF5